MTNSEQETHAFVMSGSEMALLNAALFALGNWPFVNDQAKRMLSSEARIAGDELDDRIFLTWRDFLGALGLWGTDPWTPELIARRARTTIEVALTDEDRALAVLALRASFAEFAHNWHDFCVALPGNIDWYPVQAVNLSELANRLERSP